MYLPDSWQTPKCHPTQGCGSDIFLPLLIAASRLVADAKKEDNLPAFGENLLNTVNMTLPFFHNNHDIFFYNIMQRKNYLQSIHYYSACPPKKDNVQQHNQ